MIRRDMIDDGRRAWLLISQLDHARLAADLAEAWNHEQRPLVEPRNQFIETVRRHDDGWLVWEQRPEVRQGTPRDFMEMPLDESLAIWRRSIAVAGVISPASAVIVGGHFRALLERTMAKHEARHDWPPDFEHLAEEFVAEQEDLRQSYLSDVAGDRREAETALDRGLRGLQFFDFASLWFCCAAETQPRDLVDPDGQTLQFSPRGESEVLIAPWPFRGDEVIVRFAGRLIPEAHYPSDEALAAVDGRRVEVVQTLRPDGSCGV